MALCVAMPTPQPFLLAQVVKSVHYKRLPVGRVVAGQTAALALKRIKRHQVGDVLSTLRAVCDGGIAMHVCF